MPTGRIDLESARAHGFNRRAALALLAVATIWTVAVVATRISHAPAVAIGASIDASLTAAIAVYLIAVRRGHLPRWTIPVTASAGLLIARLVIARGPGLGNAVLIAAGAVEIAMFALAIAGSRRAVRSWRAARAGGAPLLDGLEAAITALGLPVRLARFVATELTLVGYAVTGWRAPRPTPERFTVHRSNGWTLYAGVLLFLTAVETVVVHIALAAFASPTAAWIVTALSIYSALWVLGDLHALRHGGVVIGRAALELAIGVRWRGRIPWSAIAAIEQPARAGAPAPLARSAAVEPGAVDAGILEANVVLRLHAPCTLLGLLGRRREATSVALSIDEPERFVAIVESRRS